MITVEESNNLIAQLSPMAGVEKVQLMNSLGRIVAEPIIADINQPPFDKSAMDGYACKRKDLLAPLQLIGVIAAGSMAAKPVGDGECYRIFTGAPVPAGADCVIMQEDTKVDSSGKICFVATQTKNNICLSGEDSKSGDVVVETGIRILPQHLAIMASYGVMQPSVFRRLTSVVYCSGSELVEPDVFPENGMIRNSNASQLLSQLQLLGVDAEYKGIISDQFEVVSRSITGSAGKTDLIFITGGASVGDFDFIPEVLKHLGAEMIVSSLKIQPGKPVLFAKLGETFIFGLSGNPVSSFLQFKVLAEPAIRRLQGAKEFLPKMVQIPLATELSRKKGGRQLYVPIRIDGSGKAQPVAFHGSAHIQGLNQADGFAILHPEIHSIPADQLAPVILL